VLKPLQLQDKACRARNGFAADSPPETTHFRAAATRPLPVDTGATAGYMLDILQRAHPGPYMPCTSPCLARLALLLLPVTALLACPARAAGVAPADTVYEHGYVYTVDPHSSVQQALAVRDGLIVYAGTDRGVQAYIGPATRRVDLAGHMLMPGLVDGHLHPAAGGAALAGCDLKYERLTVAQMQERIQACLDQSRGHEPDAWLEVRNWFQEAMVGDTTTSRATLDVLKTQRPIMVHSSFGHTVLLNTRALQLAQITAATPSPAGGQIVHEASGEPSGLLQDTAGALPQRVLPPPTPEDNIQAAAAALQALAGQGVTSFLDAAAVPPTLAAFSALDKQGRLTARAHFAVLINADQTGDIGKTVAGVTALARQYDGGPLGPVPHLTVRNIKLFLDGVITAPAMTGAMLEPYRVNTGTPQQPHWAPGPSNGPATYFPAPVLRQLLLAAAAAGFEPHMHADGDRAVHDALDGIEALRKRYPEQQIRAAIAHDEIVDPRDFPRFQRLGAIPVLSMQWEKPAPDTVDGARDYLGPARYRYMEPAAFLADAGARIAYGSDWPVDPLDEWFALKVGVTRTNRPDSGFSGRLSEDRGLTPAQVLAAITYNSSYELHQETFTGSLEPGKLADLVILDRNVLQIPREEIAQVHVLETIVGGRTVYRAGQADSASR
jgi:predicted amidohydrolase YtcJ